MIPLKRLALLVEKIEDVSINPFQWVLIFFSIVIARNFLEQFGPDKVVFNFPSFFLHFPFAYVAPILALSVLLALLAREKVERVTKLMLFAWFLTLVPPLLDLVVGRGGGERIGYLHVDRGNVLYVLVNFFNPVANLRGTTPGIRIEAFLGCILACLYVFLKTGDRARTVLTLFAIYLSFMFFFILPYGFITLLSFVWPRFGSVASLYFESGLFLKSHIDRVAYSIALLDLFLILLLLMLWTRLYSRAILASIFERIARFEPIHYCLATLFGILLALKAVHPDRALVSVHPFDVFSGISLMISVVCAYWVGSAVGDLPSKEGVNRFLMSVMFALVVLFSGAVSYSALVFALAFAGFLSLYHTGPMKLSAYFPVSTILIALATLSSMLLGFSTVAGTLVPMLFPRHVILATLVSCTSAFIAKDYLKPGRRGRLPAAVLVFLGFASVGLILKSGFLVWAGVILGLCSAAFLALSLRVRTFLHASYGILALLIGVMTLRRELPLAHQTNLDKEQILHVEMGKEFQIGRMYEEAAIQFEKAVSAGWKDAETFFALGFAYQETGQLEESAYWYRRALSEDSTKEEAYNNLGLVLRRLERADSSLAVLRRGLEKDPGSARLLRNLFLTLFDLDRFDELIPMLERYVDANPGDYRTREVLADAYMKDGAEDIAEIEYRKVLGTRQGYVPAIVGLGYIMANRGEVGQAEKYFLVALQLDSTNVDAMHRLGYIYLDRGDVQDAIALFRETVKLEPLVANHYDSLGDAHFRGEQYEEAREAYQMALALDSTFAHPRQMLKRLGKLGYP
ncbi:MAG: tetratricopeptide repeat protein [bacterium]